MYIKINGSDVHYESNIVPFKTQHGNNGVRVLNGMPTTTDGFKVYNDDGTVFSDFSDYTFIYKENEYTAVEEEIDPAECSFDPLPPSAYEKMVKRINQINTKVNKITPYKETKKAYYGEIEKVFYGIPQGNTTVFFSNYEGEYEINHIENRLIISFPERLTDMTDITIMVQ